MLRVLKLVSVRLIYLPLWIHVSWMFSFSSNEDFSIESEDVKINPSRLRIRDMWSKYRNTRKTLVIVQLVLSYVSCLINWREKKNSDMKNIIIKIHNKVEWDWARNYLPETVQLSWVVLSAIIIIMHKSRSVDFELFEFFSGY